MKSLRRLEIAARCALLLVLIMAPAPARGDDLKSQAARMSDRAFALLAALNAQSASATGANPLIGPVAGFASDAQTLSGALARDDRNAETSAVAALHSDRAALDSALAAHPGALDASAWRSIKQQLDSIVGQLAATSGGSAAIGAVAAAAPSAPLPPVAVAPPSTAVTASTAAPKLVVESRHLRGGVARITGYMQGTALKSAGLYENGRLLRSFMVNDVAGRQKLVFDLKITNARPYTIIRVTDAQARFAQAPVLESALTTEAPDSPEAPGDSPGAAPALSAPPPMVEAPLPAPEAAEPPVEVLRGGDSSAGSTANTREIPSRGAPVPSPSKRHTLGGALANVQINIVAVTQVETSPPSYDVAGMITGRGLTRAGIYVEGRLVQEIPIDEGTGVTSFDQQFEIEQGAATIRVYGARNQFVESSINLGIAGTAPAVPMVPMMPMARMAAAGVAVQILSVSPIAANLFVVSGVVSGRAIASAGLFQNGMLVQNLDVSGGIGGLIGGLVPGASRSVNFSARFNPYAGPVSVRAFDTSGGYAEQPLVISAANPYGYGSNPYGYGINPYAGTPNPYGTPNYGAPPRGPYWPPVNPYGFGGSHPAPTPRQYW